MANNDNEFKEFKAELSALLKKYNACIGVDVQGDTHGLMYDFTVEINRKDYTLVEGNAYIDVNDLED